MRFVLVVLCVVRLVSMYFKVAVVENGVLLLALIHPWTVLQRMLSNNVQKMWHSICWRDKPEAEK